MLPGVVSFNAQPNTQTSLYITWDHPPTTHPLLLRYEVNVQQVGTGELLTSSPPPGVRSHVVTGLLSGELYRVSVVATSLLGRGEESEQDILVRTFEPRELTNTVLCLYLAVVNWNFKNKHLAVQYC